MPLHCAMCQHKGSTRQPTAQGHKGDPKRGEDKGEAHTRYHEPSRYSLSQHGPTVVALCLTFAPYSPPPVHMAARSTTPPFGPHSPPTSPPYRQGCSPTRRLTSPHPMSSPRRHSACPNSPAPRRGSSPSPIRADGPKKRRPAPGVLLTLTAEAVTPPLSLPAPHPEANPMDVESLPPPTCVSPAHHSPPPTALVARPPNTAFGIALALAAHALLWRVITRARAPQLEGLAWAAWSLALFVWVLLLVLYFVKAARWPRLVCAEWSHPLRAPYFFAPHVALLLLLLAAPGPATPPALACRGLWLAAALVQLVLDGRRCGQWLYGGAVPPGEAAPLHCIGVVGWFLLTTLGQAVGVEGAWGLPLPTYAFGCGAFFYLLAINLLLRPRAEAGDPALLLLLAPPAAAAVALADLSGSFGAVPQALFGCARALVCAPWPPPPPLCLWSPPGIDCLLQQRRDARRSKLRSFPLPVGYA